MLLTLAVLPLALGSSACQQAGTADPAAPASPGAASPGSCSFPAGGQAAKTVDPPSTADVPTSGTVTSVITTNAGEIKVELDQAAAPCTVHSFLSLAKQGYFDATSCHRLTTAGILVLQCGDPTGTGSGGPGYTFADETRGGESYVRGVVAMANSGPDTNGSQFFLVWGDSTGLDQTPNYTIFGRMDDTSVGVVERIAADGVGGGASDGKPVNPAQIVKVSQG
jgi:cyclophilin family peptidyl-prolyl cis-trans isomerase